MIKMLFITEDKGLEIRNTTFIVYFSSYKKKMGDKESINKTKKSRKGTWGKGKRRK